MHTWLLRSVSRDEQILLAPRARAALGELVDSPLRRRPSSPTAPNALPDMLVINFDLLLEMAKSCHFCKLFYGDGRTLLHSTTKRVGMQMSCGNWTDGRRLYSRRFISHSKSFSFSWREDAIASKLCWDWNCELFME
jgi:hypothetical protein